MIRKLLFGFVALVVLAGALIGIGFATGVFQVPEVQEVANDWGKVTQESTEVVTSITLDNPNPVGISLGAVALEADIALNEVDFGRGTLDGIDIPKGVSTTQLVTRIDNAVIPEWWATHISNGERTTARIVPKGTVSLFGKRFGFSAPAITRTIETDLLSEANSDTPEEFGLGPVNIVLQSRQFSWGETTPEETTVEGVLTVHNPNAFFIPVTQLGFTVVMNGVQVAEGTAAGLMLLTANGETAIPIEAVITNKKLIEWWPTHVNNGERTDYTIQVDAVLEVDLPLVGIRGISINLVDFTDSFQTKILG